MNAKQRVALNKGSMEELCREAICTADVELMEALGFPTHAAEKISEAVKAFADESRLGDLKQHYLECMKAGSGTIINHIIREKHPVYFCSRANVHPMVLLEKIDQGGQDVAAYALARARSNAQEMSKNRRETLLEKERASAVRHLQQEMKDVFHL